MQKKGVLKLSILKWHLEEQKLRRFLLSTQQHKNQKTVYIKNKSIDFHATNFTLGQSFE